MAKRRGTPAANGLSVPARLSLDDSLDVSYEEGEGSWDSFDVFPLVESPSVHSHPHQLNDQEQQFDSTMLQRDEGIAIVQNIASFLTLSDAASIASIDRHMHHEAKHHAHASGNDWAVGMEFERGMGHPVTSWNSSLNTPSTPPGLMALSPSDGSIVVDEDSDEDSLDQRLERRHKRWVQQKLTVAVFSHPRSLRSFCLDAHEAAKEIHRKRQEYVGKRVEDDPETFREPPESMVRMHRRSENHQRLLRFLVDTLLHNVPLSVLMDLVEISVDTGLDTSYSVFRISVSSMNAAVSGIIHVVQRAWDVLMSCNPFAILDAIISMQFNAMGKTSEALASGIQSVATGVGSASNAALQRLSRSGGMATNTSTSSSASLNEKLGLRRSRSSQNSIALNQKLLRKLSTINSAAQIISYSERDNEALTKHAKKRVQRMMHYEVNLRPFVATVVDKPPRRSKNVIQEDSFGIIDFPSNTATDADLRPHNVSPESSDESSPLESPFMCTPSSFPQTPASRSLVLARGTRFADDVVFLARDQLRVEGGLHSENERTKAMATALREGKRFAVFNAEDVASGIALTCGQHVATKVGNELYASTRSMVAVLRNCFVYFEMTAICPPNAATTLFIGLSTLEMPLNTLVGAWKSSIGLCSTGQIMTAGQWCSPLDPSLSAYGHNSTVGCLVCLDDRSAFETWDGVMVTASVTFNVNGTLVSPPVFTTPMAGAMPSPAANGNQQRPQQLRGVIPPSTTLPLLVPVEEELFPTLTLHSPATQVICRFSAEDVLATSCEGIGAPPGATVYAVDGSVLFGDQSSSSSSSSS